MPMVTVLPDGERIPARPGETILQALFNSGYSYRIGCRRGGCAICKIDLRDGEVTYNATVAPTVLSDDERAAGTCLSCRAVPAGDVTIELRDSSIRLTNRMLRQFRLAEYEKAAAARAADAAQTDPQAPDGA